MSQVSNHQPEVLDARRCHNPQSEDEQLMRLDYEGGLWFEDNADYDSEERARLDDEEEARVLEEIRLSGMPY